MPVILDDTTELIASRGARVGRDGLILTRVYWVEADDYDLIADALPAYGDPHPNPIHHELVVTDVSIEPKTDDNRFVVTITYQKIGIDPAANDNGEVWEYNFVAQTAHITSVDSEDKQFHFPSWRDEGTAIGVDGDSINGADVFRPAFQAKVTKNYESLSSSQIRWFTENTPSLNDKNWIHWEPGEVLFVGAVIRKLERHKYQVEYSFLVAKHQPAISFTDVDGNTIGPLAVGAWQYKWFTHVQKNDSAEVTPGDEKQIVKSGIEAVHVAYVYGNSDFSFLDIRGGD